MTEDVSYEKDGSVSTIWLNRPESLNALTKTVRHELLAGLRQAERDGTVRCLVMRGRGRAFSVGQDLKELEAYYEERGPELGRLVQEEYIPIVETLRSLSKPTIAVVEGPAVGGGMALALATDFRLVGAKGRLVPGFVNVGLAPDTGTTFLLGRSIGYARALSRCLTGQPITADEMVQWGLADDIASTPEDLDQSLKSLTTRLSNGPTRAYATIRRLFDQAQHLPLDAVLQLERDAQDDLAGTRDHRAANRAFLTKSTPEFRGE